MSAGTAAYDPLRAVADVLLDCVCFGRYYSSVSEFKVLARTCRA
jgi:hypothetical protein